jgi:hypothetical protein
MPPNRNARLPHSTTEWPSSPPVRPGEHGSATQAGAATLLLLLLPASLAAALMLRGLTRITARLGSEGTA